MKPSRCEALKLLARSILVTLEPNFTGRITVELDFCAGQLKVASVGSKETERFGN